MTVLTADHGAVRVLTMNRPQARNALNPELIGALYTGLLEAARLGMAYFEQFITQDCITATAKMRTPIIGAINGPVFTGGLEMALGCDFLVASQRAVFADIHARVGILPGGGMTARLPHWVGAATARRMSMEW